jgi:hypothetical protein
MYVQEVDLQKGWVEQCLGTSRCSRRVIHHCLIYANIERMNQISLTER